MSAIEGLMRRETWPHEECPGRGPGHSGANPEASAAEEEIAEVAEEQSEESEAAADADDN